MQTLISDIIEELKRLQIEHGDIIVLVNGHEQDNPQPAWPEYNQEKKRIEF